MEPYRIRTANAGVVSKNHGQNETTILLRYVGQGNLFNTPLLTITKLFAVHRISLIHYLMFATRLKPSSRIPVASWALKSKSGLLFIFLWLIDAMVTMESRRKRKTTTNPLRLYIVSVHVGRRWWVFSVHYLMCYSIVSLEVAGSSCHQWVPRYTSTKASTQQIQNFVKATSKGTVHLKPHFEKKGEE